MTAPPVCILYSNDADLARRVKAFVRSMADLRHVSEPNRLDAVLQQAGPALLLLDLRARAARDLPAGLRAEFPDLVVIALGMPRSDPMREAEQAGVYAAEDIEMERRPFQALVGRALDYLKVVQENRDLREDSSLVPARQALRRIEPVSDRRAGPATPLLRFPRVFRRFENIDALLASVVETVADAAGVTRVGLFSRLRDGEQYRLRAGLRCLPETEEMEFTDRDPLVRWFERHARLISRGTVAELEDRAERTIVRRALDMFGAEVVIPLYARGRIAGWILFGQRAIGHPFSDADLEGFMVLSEHVSTVLENALLQEETTLQKTLAETLLKAIPPGIVAVDEAGIIRWFNPTAEQILGIPAAKALHKPIEATGKMLAEFLRESLDPGADLAARRWTDRNTGRAVLVETRRLSDRTNSLGAVAVIHDLTTEQSLQQKQEVIDRAAFWADLAASMSHEIRNPLVAIKTFAQLLPERFDDADFRRQFNQIVVQEIDRLDRIITQINDFAHPPELVLKPIDLRAPVEKAIDIARTRFGFNGKVALETSLPSDLPPVLGDEKALAEAFAHLLANAAEASTDRDHPKISLIAKPLREGDGVVVTVRDNGHGIDPELKDKIFSPFCTTKPRGIGLGLPIVKRTVFDHRGRVEVDSSRNGTQISVVLPSETNGD